jgi:hypothetical protein
MFLGSRGRPVLRADNLTSIAQAVRRWLLTSQSWVQYKFRDYTATYTTGLWVCFSGGGGVGRGLDLTVRLVRKLRASSLCRCSTCLFGLVAQENIAGCWILSTLMIEGQSGLDFSTAQIRDGLPFRSNIPPQFAGTKSKLSKEISQRKILACSWWFLFLVYY